MSLTALQVTYNMSNLLVIFSFVQLFMLELWQADTGQSLSVNLPPLSVHRQWDVMHDAACQGWAT